MKKIYGFFLFALFSSVSYSQRFDSTCVTFSTSSSISLENMTGADTAVKANVSNHTPSGLLTFPSNFKFKFGWNTYTSFSASPDGWIRLGSAGTIQAFYNLAVTTDYHIIAPYWSGLFTSSGGMAVVSFCVTTACLAG